MSRPLLPLLLVHLQCGGGAPQPGGAPDASILPPTDLAALCPDKNPPDGGTCIASIRGKVVDATGLPINQLVLSYCAEGCFFGKTDATGAFTIAIHAHLPPGRYAILLHAAPDRVSYYWRLPTTAGSAIVLDQPLVLFAAPTDGPTIALDKSAQTLTTPSGVVLTLAAGTDVSLDVDDVAAGPLGQKLRPVAIAAGDLARVPFVDPASPPIGLYGFEPFETTFSQPASLSFPNATHLAAGTAVDIATQHGLIATMPPAGAFDPIGGGHVSSDGKRIDMDPGVGVTTLTWIAIHKKGT